MDPYSVLQYAWTIRGAKNLVADFEVKGGTG
jgi:hypothetical protein